MYLITTKKLNEVVLLGIGNVFLQNLAVFYLFDWDWGGFCWRWNLYFVIWASKISINLGNLRESWIHFQLNLRVKLKGQALNIY
jgi:hypothetical protein